MHHQTTVIATVITLACATLDADGYTQDLIAADSVTPSGGGVASTTIYALADDGTVWKGTQSMDQCSYGAAGWFGGLNQQLGAIPVDETRGFVVGDSTLVTMSTTGVIRFRNESDLEIEAEFPAVCEGDVNHDGAIDVVDLVELIENWGAVCDRWASGPLAPSVLFKKVRLSNSVNYSDIVYRVWNDGSVDWVRISGGCGIVRIAESRCPGDLTADGLVDVQDLGLLILNWGPCP